MRVLVAGVDSDIGKEIARQHIERGDEVSGTSRNKLTRWHMELSHPLSWPKFGDLKFDVVYYTIGIGDHRASRMEVMQVNCFASCDFLNHVAPNVVDDGQIVVLSSEWGSITRTANTRAGAYRMSKAALNMGVKICSLRHTRLRWTLMQPGLVATKMTRNINESEHTVTPEASAAGIIEVAARTSLPFSFVDHTGQTLEF